MQTWFSFVSEIKSCEKNWTLVWTVYKVKNSKESYYCTLEVVKHDGIVALIHCESCHSPFIKWETIYSPVSLCTTLSTGIKRKEDSLRTVIVNVGQGRYKVKAHLIEKKHFWWKTTWLIRKITACQSIWLHYAVICEWRAASEEET